MIKSSYVFFEDQLTRRRRHYQNPSEIITAHTQQEVKRALARMEMRTKQGKYLAGYFAYELGYLFEETLRSLLPQKSHSPLLQFGVFDTFSGTELPNNSMGSNRGSNWGNSKSTLGYFKPDWSQNAYQKRFDKIMTWIKSGDVYQVNLTFPMRGQYSGNAFAIYTMLKSAQPVRYGGIVSLGANDIVSLSPELFYELDQETISMRPMKGTVKRGHNRVSDTALAQALQADTKNRAENLMIVDLLRNDLSRIARPGSVAVTDLYTLETYPSLHTMTSGIEARIKDVPLVKIIQALFPCGSVTGAPKIRAQEIIHGLETVPRGAYCGAVGLVDPDGYSRFNVAIRTLELQNNGHCKYSVGSGIVADSNANDEYAECLLKSAFLKNEFGLIETIAWHEQTGFMWLDLHMERLEKSAAALGYLYRKGKILEALQDCVTRLSGPQKIRLELSKSGKFMVAAHVLHISNPAKAMPVTLSNSPLSSGNALLAHKTTRRDFIEAELLRLGDDTGCTEVLFFNEQGQVCEGSYTNVFISKDGKMFTPPITCGLLPGVLRQALLESGDVHEKILTQDDLRRADEIYIGNSVRGLMRARLTSPDKK